MTNDKDNIDTVILLVVVGSLILAVAYFVR
jgi:hypothetical protein